MDVSVGAGRGMDAGGCMCVCTEYRAAVQYGQDAAREMFCVCACVLVCFVELVYVWTVLLNPAEYTKCCSADVLGVWSCVFLLFTPKYAGIDEMLPAEGEW